MAANNLTYYRGTQFAITHVYQINGVNATTGTKLLFTIKATPNDTSSTDSTAIYQADVTMTGATNVITIPDTAISDTVLPGTYFYDIKVLDSVSGLLLAASGQFIIVATPTNRTS